MRLENAAEGSFSVTFERTPFFFQEYGVAINALGQTIADGPNPNGPPMSGGQQIKYFTETGLFDLLGKIKSASIESDTSRTDDQKKAEPVISTLRIEATEIELRVLVDSLENYHDTTDREIASIRAFNLVGATTRRLEGGMATLMAKVIEETIPGGKSIKPEKPTVGFGRVLD